MDQYNIHEAKTHLSKLIERVMNGEDIIIAKAGKPCVKLTSVSQNNAPQQRLGLMRGQIQMTDNWDSPQTNKDIEKLLENSSIFPDTTK